MVSDLRPVALADVLPVQAERVTSDAALPLWRGYLHALVGEGESGKTWLAAHAAMDATERGTVLVLDGEMSAPSWRHRLAVLGAERSQLQRVCYVEMTAAAADVETVRGTVAELGAVLLVWDSALSLISRTAQSENDNAAVSKVYDRLREIVRGGPAGLIVDHSARGSGSLVSRGATAKFNALDLSYGVRLTEDSIPGPSHEWGAVVSVEKDRHGLTGERRDLAASWLPVGPGRTHLDLVPAASSSHRLSTDNPTRRVLAQIEQLDPPPMSGNEAHRRIGGTRSVVLAAFKQYSQGGTGGTGSIEPYRRTTSTEPVRTAVPPEATA